MNEIKLPSFLFLKLSEVFSCWENDFDVTPHEEQSYEDDHWYYIYFTIYHRLSNNTYTIRCRCNETLLIQIDFGNDDWIELNKENVFAYLWFDQISEELSQGIAKDTGGGCSLCGSRPATNIEGTYWLCKSCKGVSWSLIKKMSSDIKELKIKRAKATMALLPINAPVWYNFNSHRVMGYVLEHDEFNWRVKVENRKTGKQYWVHLRDVLQAV